MKLQSKLKFKIISRVCSRFSLWGFSVSILRQLVRISWRMKWHWKFFCT